MKSHQKQNIKNKNTAKKKNKQTKPTKQNDLKITE